ncbi:NAD-dependent epimerase/dehydratase family protein [Agromyces sp. NPDC056965]|uniref:NAD-dependent epimerase/dehydratase family protein n=1 Tax=Agromyces sp. NPDC056965 TaxID=3345983 RepID=UPI003640E6FC
MTRTVLITGGAGFIGSNLARRLSDDDSTSVRVLDDLSTGRIESVRDLDVDVIIGSILDRAALSDAMNEVDAVVHLAALGSVPASVADPRMTHDVNVNGTLNVLEEARVGRPHVIFSSSSAVFGSNPKLSKDPEDWTRPISPYGASKLAAEGYVNAYATSYGLSTLALRFFNVYGPGQFADHVYAAVIPRFVEAALTGDPLEIHGDGLQSRDFTFVDTVCEVIVDALDRRFELPHPVHLAYGTSTSLIMVVDELERAVGRPLDRRFVAARIGDVRASQSNTDGVFEYFPSVSSIGLEDGLARTLEWARMQPR